MCKQLEKQETSFRCAYNRIAMGDKRDFLYKLKKILNVVSDAAVYQYIRGDREPKLTEGLAIEQLFSEYGINVNWGCEESETKDEL